MVRCPAFTGGINPTAGIYQRDRSKLGRAYDPIDATQPTSGGASDCDIKAAMGHVIAAYSSSNDLSPPVFGTLSRMDSKCPTHHSQLAENASMAVG